MSEGNYVSGGRPFFDGLFEEWEVSAVRNAVVRFKASYPWLRFPDFDDLVQECLNQWFFTRDGYDPDRGAGIKTYMSRVTAMRLKEILREQMAEKRRLNHFSFSLDEPAGKNGEFLAAFIADEAGPDPDLVIDVQSVVAGLTTFQRDICRLLGQDYPVKRVAELLGRPRTTVRDQIGQIREAFYRRGLGGYREG